MRNLSIVGPPLFLVAIGIGIYILVAQFTSPQVTTLTATPESPNSTPSATTSASPSATPISSITTTVVGLTTQEVAAIQASVNNGNDRWRLDPLETAKQEGSLYGFAVTDAFSMSQAAGSKVESPAIISAQHEQRSYRLTVTQPATKGAQGIWVLSSIESLP
jgi:hypothetical protein